jgi:hypothetical protein
MGITCAGRGSSTQSKRSSSTPVAVLVKRLKFTPSAEGVAPRGELLPSLISESTSDVLPAILLDAAIFLNFIS